jgi:hypothetical protein
MTARRKDMTKAEAIKALCAIGYIESMIEWKKINHSENLDPALIEEYTSSGKEGNTITENAHRIKLSYRYNGSGKEAFEGADKWPVVDIQISFPENCEDKAKKFIQKIMFYLQ